MKNVVSIKASVVLFSAFEDPKKNYLLIPSRSANQNFQAVIEIPAGTNKKIEYDKNQYKFLPEQRNGKDRIINFLPYPGNYGFIPSTFSSIAEGGDDDPIDVLVLSEQVPTATVIEITPLAVLKFIDNGQRDYKIIAIPTEENSRTLSAEHFEEFSQKYPTAKQMIEDWFRNYDHESNIEIKGWGDEKDAIREIENWQVER